MLHPDNGVIITSTVTRCLGDNVAVLADLLLNLASFPHCSYKIFNRAVS